MFPKVYNDCVAIICHSPNLPFPWHCRFSELSELDDMDLAHFNTCKPMEQTKEEIARELVHGLCCHGGDGTANMILF